MKQGSRGRTWWAGAAAVLLGAVVLGSGAGVVEAQPKAAPAKAAAAKELAEVERLHAEANKLYGEGEYDAALPLAERALAIREGDPEWSREQNPRCM